MKIATSDNLSALEKRIEKLEEKPKAAGTE